VNIVDVFVFIEAFNCRVTDISCASCGALYHLSLIVIYYSRIMFVCSIKQQGLYQRSGNPWPPFRIPNLPHSAYLGLNKLLHCRTMHGVLFTLLYKVCGDNPRGKFLLIVVRTMMMMMTVMKTMMTTTKLTCDTLWHCWLGNRKGTRTVKNATSNLQFSDDHFWGLYLTWSNFGKLRWFLTWWSWWLE